MKCIYYFMCVFTAINECVSAPCRNGGRCLDRHNGYRCACKPGYTGTYCETGNYGIDRYIYTDRLVTFL